MKKSISALLTLIFLISFSSCQKTPNSDNPAQIVKGPEINTISYRTVNLESLPENVQKLINDNKVKKGYLLIDNKSYSLPNDDMYIFISSGEKSTGGYSISVTSVQQSKDLITVIVKEEAPPKDGIVTQVITYPYIIIKINKPFTKNIKVVNTSGEEFSSLIDNKTTIDFEMKDEILDEGIYVGQIDNNLIEVNIHGSAMSFRFSEKAKISFGGLKLNLGDRIFVRYHIDENGQFILTNISK